MVTLVEKLYDCEIDSLKKVIYDQIKALSQKYLQMFKTQSSAFAYLITRLKLDIPDLVEPQPLPIESSKQSEADYDTATKSA